MLCGAARCGVVDSGLACWIHGKYVSHQPGHFKQCLTMCLTALKNSLVVGNCQPIISTPSSGLSPSLSAPPPPLPTPLRLTHSLHSPSLPSTLSRYSFALLIRPPSSHFLSQTHSRKFPFLSPFISLIPYPLKKQFFYMYVFFFNSKNTAIGWFHFLPLPPTAHPSSPLLLHPVKQKQMPLIMGSEAGHL